MNRNQPWDGGRDRDREVIPPEGVPVRFRIGTAGARIGAYLLDLLIQVGIVAVLGVTAGLVDDAAVTAVVQVVTFLLMTFYHVFFELRWNGRTPGKRASGLRVMDASGGTMELASVLVRNFVRMLETTLPLSIIATGVLGEGIVVKLLGFAAGTLILCFPLFNQDRRRIGDLLAGTWVIEDPKPLLLTDLAAASASMSSGAAADFTDAQLSHYGEYELSVLETALRQVDVASDLHLMEIAGTIARKIGYRGPLLTDSRSFLRLFYRAQRNFLEQRMVLGQRRRDKFDRSKAAPPRP